MLFFQSLYYFGLQHLAATKAQTILFVKSIKKYNNIQLLLPG